MADTVKLPIEMVGMNKMMQEAQQAYSKMVQLAHQNLPRPLTRQQAAAEQVGAAPTALSGITRFYGQMDMPASSKVGPGGLGKTAHELGMNVIERIAGVTAAIQAEFERGLREQGITKGKFQTQPMSVPMQIPLPGGGFVTENLAIKPQTVDFDRQNLAKLKDRRQKMQQAFGEQAKTSKNLTAQIKESEEFLAEVETSFVEGAGATESFRTQARNDLARLKRELRATGKRETAEQKRGDAKDFAKKAKATTEEYLNAEEVLKDRIDDSMQGLQKGIDGYTEMIRELYPLRDKGLVSGGFVRGMENKRRNLRNKLDKVMGRAGGEGFKRRQFGILDPARLETLEGVAQAIEEQQQLIIDMQSAGASQAEVLQAAKVGRGLEKKRKGMETAAGKEAARTVQKDLKKSFVDRQRAIDALFVSQTDYDERLEALTARARQQAELLTDVQRAYAAGDVPIGAVDRTKAKLREHMQERREFFAQGDTFASTARARRINEEKKLKDADRQEYLARDKERARQNRVRREQRRDAARQAQKDRQQQLMMGGASIGIGLLGQAGFPLLNIGFASMSGMVIGQIAAAATAIGETARFVMRLRDAAQEGAEGLHLLTRGFKDTRGELEAYKATHGVLANIAEERLMRERLGLFQGPQVHAFTALGNAFASNMETTLRNIFVPSVRSMQATSGPGLGINAFGRGILDLARWPSELREAQESMRRHLQTFNSSIENADQMWRRIQTAAASIRPDEQKVIRKQLALVTKQLEAAENLDKAAIQLGTIIQAGTLSSITPAALGFFGR